MKSLLVLGKGDIGYSDRNRARLVGFAKKAGFDVQQADYHEINRVPGFQNETINVMFFFPFTFWNAYCEVPQDTHLYGTSKSVYEKFRDYFLSAGSQLEDRFRGHQINYIIPPEIAFIDRDKIETLRLLRASGVPTPDQVSYTCLQDVIDSISLKRGIFIKCRYGAEGKGITALHHDRWVTNYRIEKDRLANFGVYDTWQFSDITGRRELLEQLLENDVIIEKEILAPGILDGKKFDLRAYVVGQDMAHFFARVNDPKKEITNYSQGATIIHHPLTGLGKDCIGLVRRTAIQAANAMGLKFVGVDIMFDESLDAPRVVEAQCFADFPCIRKFNLAEFMVRDASGLFL